MRLSALSPSSLKPSVRRNLIFGLLALTLAAAIFAPDDTADKSAGKVAGKSIAPLSIAPLTTAPMRQTGKTAMTTAAGHAPASTTALSRMAGSMLPAQRLALSDTPKDIFYIEKPQPSAAEKSMRAAQQPAPAPVAPPLPYVYMGKILDNGQRSVFLSRNDKPYIAKPGDVLDGTYRVDAIKPPMLELTYLPLSQKQMLNIGE